MITELINDEPDRYNLNGTYSMNYFQTVFVFQLLYFTLLLDSKFNGKSHIFTAKSSEDLHVTFDAENNASEVKALHDNIQSIKCTCHPSTQEEVLEQEFEREFTDALLEILEDDGKAVFIYQYIKIECYMNLTSVDILK